MYCAGEHTGVFECVGEACTGTWCWACSVRSLCQVSDLVGVCYSLLCLGHPTYMCSAKWANKDNNYA